jgi:hypothetical protein
MSRRGVRALRFSGSRNVFVAWSREDFREDFKDISSVETVKKLTTRLFLCTAIQYGAGSVPQF